MKRLLALAALPFLLAANTPPGEIAYDVIERITTEVGPRLAATEQEARARDWAVRKLKAMGFSNVRVETFQMPNWRRGIETAEVTAPFPHRLAIAALGRSGATPPEGITAEVVRYATLEEFKAAPDAAVRGKIVYVTHAMTATQDGSSYGVFGVLRRSGPALAATKGAAAILIRSIGSENSRAPHTGGTNWPDNTAPIPAAALSTADAFLLDRIFERGRPVTLRLVLTPTFGTGESGNVIAEIPGRDAKAGIVLLGGHLDSWDLGTGAVDDGAGIAVTTAAAKALLDSGKRPRRTVRLVWFGAEEPGLFGGQDYLKRHGAETHALATESDSGDGRIWRVEFNLPEGAAAVQTRLITALSPLGISTGSAKATGDSDVSPLVATGVSAVDLSPDATRYFTLHHTAEDTLDKIDRVTLAQAAEAYTRLLAIVADAPEDLIQTRKP